MNLPKPIFAACAANDKHTMDKVGVYGLSVILKNPEMIYMEKEVFEYLKFNLIWKKVGSGPNLDVTLSSSFTDSSSKTNTKTRTHTFGVSANILASVGTALPSFGSLSYSYSR